MCVCLLCMSVAGMHMEEIVTDKAMGEAGLDREERGLVCVCVVLPLTHRGRVEEEEKMLAKQRKIGI